MIVLSEDVRAGNKKFGRSYILIPATYVCYTRLGLFGFFFLPTGLLLMTSQIPFGTLNNVNIIIGVLKEVIYPRGLTA